MPSPASHSASSSPGSRLRLLRRGPDSGPPPVRPSLLLWRHRHLVVAFCLGAAVLVALSVLRPAAPEGREVLVSTRTILAGEVIADADVAVRRVAVSALPEAGLADKRIIGARAAVRLEAGTVLTTSMTSAALAADLDPTKRIVQVPVGIGAELAVPGARVDIVGESPRLSSPALEPGGEPEGLVLCSRARVILAQQEQKGPEWGASGSKVILITLAVPASDASLVVSAATRGALGIVLSP